MAPSGTSTRPPGLAGAGLLGLLMLTSGCAGEAAVEASTVLRYGQCQGLEAGVVRVSYPEVADIRGSRLISPAPSGGRDAGAAEQPGDDPAGEPAATGPDEDAPLLVAVSRGPQPTPGYALSLEGAHRRDRTAVVTVRWQTPDPDAVLAQVMTHPCLVVGLPKSDFNRVEVVDTEGESLGAVEI